MYKDLRLLIKFPTRGRPEKLSNSLDKLLFMAYDLDLNKFSIVLTLDNDDNKTLKELDSILNEYSILVNFQIYKGVSKSKIDACNRDMNLVKDWDILLLMSDDMTPVTKGYDLIIKQDMEKYFPDLDGILHYPDGYTPLNTMCILGKKYYDRFGYIYHPDYTSLWCDNEFHIVGDLLKKQYHSNKILFKHDHPIWTGKGYDAIYEKNDQYYKIDEAVFNARKELNFGLTVNTNSNNS